MSTDRIFVISDTHFGHDNMYMFTDDSGHRVRPDWTHAAEADRDMIALWNTVVRPQDHVWHLGDVAFKSGLEVVTHLNGHKRLILGNHDKEDMREYIAAGFQKIQGSAFHFDGLVLTHIPVHERSLGNKVNIHGHIHAVPEYDHRYLNVSVERIGYRPITLEEVRARVEKNRLQAARAVESIFPKELAADDPN